MPASPSAGTAESNASHHHRFVHQLGMVAFTMVLTCIFSVLYHPPNRNTSEACTHSDRGRLWKWHSTRSTELTGPVVVPCPVLSLRRWLQYETAVLHGVRSGSLSIRMVVQKVHVLHRVISSCPLRVHFRQHRSVSLDLLPWSQ